VRSESSARAPGKGNGGDDRTASADSAFRCNNAPTMKRTAIAVLFAAGVAGCATAPPSDRAANDPFEPWNRAVFDFNDKLDTAVIKPVAQAYLDVIPAFVRDRVRAFIDNLAEPRIFVNDLLQGRPDSAGITLSRFLANTIAGVGGLFDVATGQGLKRQTGDFGQTLYAWGVDDGPYLVLLFFGPSNVRDAIGLGVDLYTTPPAQVVHGDDATAIGFGTGVVDGIDLRSRNIGTLEALKASSLDYYTHFRSIWRQHRAAALREARGQKAEPPEVVDPGATPEDPQK
jgi:phospholipid-binding lipoprotein MlaA